jgi:3-oxoadipate enol-lactonase
MPEDGVPSGIPPGRAIDLPGRGTTWVREAGSPSGVPLILLHGFTATAALNWGPSFGPLATEFRVIALDHRGHGRGIRPSARRGFRLEDCADDVTALADALDIDQFAAVGYSMGGPIAQLTWQRHPDRVAGLVLCATACTFRRVARPGPQAMVAQGMMTGAAAAVRSIPTPLRRQIGAATMTWRRRAMGLPQWVLEEVSRNDPAALLEAMRALQRFDSRPWIGTVDVPTAVVVTTLDNLVPPRSQMRLATAIAGATVWPVEGDHAVCAMQPRLFVPALLDACRSVVMQRARQPVGEEH